MADWVDVGLHSYRVDEDVVFWRMVQLMDEPHIELLLAAVDGVLARFGHSVLVVDCTQATTLSAEARRRYADWLRNNPYPRRASVFFGATEEMQTFLQLARRAGELLSGKRSAIESFSHADEAWQRVAELRTEWQAPRRSDS